MEVTKAVELWFERAVPEPTVKNQYVQLACHLEEVFEMLDDLKLAEPVGTLLFETKYYLSRLVEELKDAANQTKPLVK